MSLDRETRRRLSALSRPDATAAAATADPTPVAPRREVLSVGDSEERHGSLDQVLPGLEREVEAGLLYELTTPLAALGPWAEEALQRAQEAARAGRLGNHDSAQVVFFDTETTALSNAPLFLVGALTIGAEAVVIRQLLARDYSEEPAVLAEAQRLLQAADLAVSYNGVGFDVPYLQDRMRYHRLGALELPRHLDLLPVARRKLGRSLGNCKLQTLELHLCRRQRSHDIEGQHIPQAYHDFVAEGDAWQMRRIVEHNAYDIVTLAELAAHLAD